MLINFGKQHQYAVVNDVPIQLSFTLQFYLLCLLLNSSDGNNAKHDVFYLVYCY